MILHGNARGNSKELAHHLQKDENERVEVYQIRGFISRNLPDALRESYALSRATKCKQHLYSLSFNPPKNAAPTPEDFEVAINKVEKQLGLDNQPRAIVFHEKRGLDGDVRKHAHAVWCRIDIENMKAIPLPFTKLQLREVSRDLFIQHNWRMPEGLLDRQNRNPRNFTLAEWQQAKRAGKDPKQLKAMFQDTWTLSDGKTALMSALWEQGYVLAQGRRGHVAVDYKGEVYPLSRWTGQKAKHVRERLGNLEDLPTIEQAHATAARMLTNRLEELRDEQSNRTRQKLDTLERTRRNTQKQQDIETRELAEQQRKKQQAEQARQEARLRKGLPGLLDRFTGKRKRTLEQNAAEARHTQLKAQNERAILQAQYDAAHKTIQAQSATHKSDCEAIDSELKQDIKWLERPAELKQSCFDSKAEERRKRREKERCRDGPSLER